MFTNRVKSSLFVLKRIMALFVVFFVSNSVFGVTYYQRNVTNGNWTSSTTWTTSNGWEATANTGTYPQAGDDVVFLNNNNSASIILDTNITINDLTFGGSAPTTSISFGSNNLTLTGNWNNDNNSNTTISQTSGFLVMSGTNKSIIMNNTSKSIANLRLGSNSISKSAHSGNLTITGIFDMNDQTSFTHALMNYNGGNVTVSGTIAKAASMNMAVSGTIDAGSSTFTYSGNGAIAGGTYARLITSGSLTIACNVTVTTSNSFTNSGTITGPTVGSYARFVNSSAVANSGTIGASSSYLAFSGTISGGTVGANVLTSSGTAALCGGGTLTLANPTSAVGASNVCASTTNAPIHAFNITGTVTVNSLTNFTFTTTGNYLAAEVSNFKIWQNTSNNLGAATLLATLTAPGAAGAKSFPAFSQNFAIGETRFFWITMDVAGSVTNNNTIGVSASIAADMTTAALKAGAASASATQTLKANSTIAHSSGTVSPTLCINTAITTNIVHTVGGGGTGAGVTGLPTGVTGTYNAGTFTISGTPSVSGSFPYTITTTGSGCTETTASGTITVNPDHTISLTSGTASPSLCRNTALTNIVYTIGGGATSASITAGALPAGVTGNFSGSTFTISGTPTAAGPFNYTVTTSGNSCLAANSTSRTITVNAIPTVTPGGADTKCQSATPSAYALTGASVGGGASNGTWAIVSGGGTLSSTASQTNANIPTITYTPAVNFTGTATLSLTTETVSGCSATANRTVNVNPISTIVLTSGSTSQSVCKNVAISNITYTVGGAGTSASASGLPTGVTGSYNAGTKVLTISGTPTTAVGSPFNYTVTTSGSSCTEPSLSGTITVNDIPTVTPAGADTKCQSSSPAAFALTGASVSGVTTSGAWAIVSGGGSLSSTAQTTSPAAVTYTPAANFTGTVTLSLTSLAVNSCSITANRTVTVNPISTIALTSAAGTTSQSVCNNVAISNITYLVGGAGAGASVSGLPTGVTGSYNAGTKVLTISGTPTTAVGSPFNYTVTTTGSSCTEPSLTGTITVNAAPTATAAGPDMVCQSATPSAFALTGASVGAGATAGAWAIVSGGGTLSSTAQTATPATVTYTPAANFTGTVTLSLTTNTVSGCSATSNRTVSVNCQVTASTATVSGFSCSPSTSQSFTISGSGLAGSGNITATGSAAYEVSNDNITFGNTATFPYAAGVITTQPRTVHVRLKSGLAPGTYNGQTISITGSGPTVNITANGSVVAGATVTSSNFTPVNTNVANAYSISGGTSYIWSRAAVAGITQAAVSGQTSSTITETLNNTTTSAIAVPYTITAFSAGGCPGPPFTYIVSVNPLNSTTCQAVPAAVPQPTCASLTLLNSGTTATTLSANTSYGFCNAGSSIVSTGNIDGAANAPIYVLSGQNVTISGTINIASNVYVFAGATLNLTGDFNTTGSNIYVYGTMNHAIGGIARVQGNPATIYVAPGGVYNATTLQINGGDAGPPIIAGGAIINEGTMNINTFDQLQGGAKLCLHNSGCLSLSSMSNVSISNQIITFGGSVGYMYSKATTCPTQNNSVTTSSDMKICSAVPVSGGTAGSTSSPCSRFGPAQVLYGCTPSAPSNNCSGAIALPITLTFFKPTLTNEGVIVKWGTNSQWDSEYFIIEKSKNGIDWEYVNTLPSENGKYRYKEFSITDPNPYEGDSYYRLVEVDKNEKRTVYATDFIHNDKSFAGFSIYPNPSNGSFIVAINGDSPQYQMSVFDVLGKNLGVFTLSAGKNEISTTLSSGIYLAKLKVGQDYFTQTIVIQ